MRFHIRAALIAVPLSASMAAAQVPVNLNTWSPQSYPAVSGFGAGNWIVAPNGESVRQSVNGQPTMFASDFNAQGTEVAGRIRVNSANDDDFIGFALGYHIADITNPLADYLLVDWKKGDQFFDFGSPSTTPGTTANNGLAVSRVQGIPTADEFWGHTNFASHTGGGLTELQRATNLGGTGWVVGTTYDFRFVFLPNMLQVFVNNTLELNINGSFNDGSMAFYNFSQADVTYSAFTVRQLPPTTTVAPEPASLAMLATGLFAIGGTMARRKRV
ncbi:MAG: PEP-CTERM sorting domain-containing protein [Gemmatimonas sp.]